MKKINLENLDDSLKLSRAELKNILGGTDQCPANSQFNGSHCVCYEGYSYCNGACIPVDEAGNCGGESVSGLCRISYTYSGEKREYLRDFGTQFSGSHVSGLANSECLSALSNPYITQCSYDCGWDGWGN